MQVDISLTEITDLLSPPDSGRETCKDNYIYMYMLQEPKLQDNWLEMLWMYIHDGIRVIMH